MFVPHAAVCVAGGIQPGILQRALGQEHRDSGLAARLLLSCPPRKVKTWTEADIDPAAEDRLAELFDRLYDLEPGADDEGKPQPGIVRLSPDAKAAWTAYYNAHAVEQAEMTGDLSAAWAKLEEYAARLSLVVHLTRWAGGDPSERRAYIPVSDARRVVDHCPNVWWKLMVALARFGGLRIPSEAFSLTWGDVDWERGRLSVPSPKTECSGKTHRVIPLFPLLRPYLEAAFEHAEEGAVYVLPAEYRRRAQGERGWGGANLRTTLGKIIRRAGGEPWPRVWHSLRASCESDLAQSFPLAVVTKWLGNTPSVALRHYVDPTEATFELAMTWVPPEGGAKCGAPGARFPAQQVPADNRTESQPPSENPEQRSVYASPRGMVRDFAKYCTNEQRECMGIEPTGGVVHTPHWF